MMIRVLDEARSVAFYRKAFGLEVAERLEFDDFVLIYLRNDESDFELERRSRCRAYALRGRGAGAAQDRGIRAQRRPSGAFFLRAGSGRLPDRSAPAPRALSL